MRRYTQYAAICSQICISTYSPPEEAYRDGIDMRSRCDKYVMNLYCPYFYLHYVYHHISQHTACVQCISFSRFCPYHKSVIFPYHESIAWYCEVLFVLQHIVYHINIREKVVPQLGGNRLSSGHLRERIEVASSGAVVNSGLVSGLRALKLDASSAKPAQKSPRGTVYPLMCGWSYG